MTGRHHTPHQRTRTAASARRRRRVWVALSLLAGAGLYWGAYHWAGVAGVIGLAVFGATCGLVRSLAEQARDRRNRRGGRR